MNYKVTLGQNFPKESELGEYLLPVILDILNKGIKIKYIHLDKSGENWGIRK